jgi:pimeloyl-ACP methyl ester carboxylesterase
MRGVGHVTREYIKIEHHGRTIYGIADFPEGTGKWPIVIFCHGFNGSADDFAEYSEYLAARGVASYRFDFCGGSVRTRSSLKMYEMSLFTEKEDLVAVLESVKKWDRVDKNNIFVLGMSQGGAVSALAADEHAEDIRGLVLVFPAFCIPDDWNKWFPTRESIPDRYEFWEVTLGRPYIEAVHGYDIYEHIGKYDREVLIFHGDKDEVVPIRYGLRAAELYPNAKIEVYEGEGHGFSEPYHWRVVEKTYELVMKNK